MGTSQQLQCSMERKMRPELLREWEDMSGIKTEKCGLFLSRDGITGATPDRLIGDDGLLEVKTLPKLVRKGITLEDYIKQSGHLKECPLNRDEYGNVTLKTSHNHYHQVQGSTFTNWTKILHPFVLDSFPIHEF